MECNDDEDSGDDVIEFEDCVLTVEDGGDSGNVKQTANGFVVESEDEINEN